MPVDPQTKKRRWTIGGILGGLASVATILSLFIASSHSSASTSSAPPQYPANVQANYLNACEQNASVTACGCTLTWFETNVTLAQFQQDEANFVQSGTPDADMEDAITACT